VEKTDGIRPEKHIKKMSGTLRSDIMIFSVFFFLSFIFWYLNSLGKAIQSDIKYPVKFINVPKDRELALAPTRLNLFLQGTGFSMLRLKISGNSDPAIIDLSKVPYKSVRNNINGFLSDYIRTCAEFQCTAEAGMPDNFS